MPRFNSNGQWTLSGDEDTLMFKTGEKKQSGKNKLIERKKVDPDSEEAKRIFNELAKSIIDSAPKQPTNEELFGHLVPTEEQVQKADKEWNGAFELFYKRAQAPIEDQDSKENRDWGNKGSFLDQLTDEELRKYKETR